MLGVVIDLLVHLILERRKIARREEREKKKKLEEKLYLKEERRIKKEERAKRRAVREKNKSKDYQLPHFDGTIFANLWEIIDDYHKGLKRSGYKVDYNKESKHEHKKRHEWDSTKESSEEDDKIATV
ncbi:hypothetical protein ACJX0J_036830, partial [Zea mays]